MVLRGGRVAAMLEGARNSEESILRAAVLDEAAWTMAAMTDTAPKVETKAKRPALRGWLPDRAPFVACLMLVSDRRGLRLAAEGRVHTRRAQHRHGGGDDADAGGDGTDDRPDPRRHRPLHGGVISLGTVLAATQFGTDPLNILMSGIILLFGFGIGMLNGC